MQYLFVVVFMCLFVGGVAQAVDTAGPFGGPTFSSPFKSISLVRVAANGHKDSGTVDVVFTATNQSTKVTSLVFSINPTLSKAADDLDSIYPIDQLRFGTTRKDPETNTTVELRPDQALHCGAYLIHVPLTAQYIRKFVLFTSLKADDGPPVEDNIILTNLPIIWK
jgi:hypothetical protein